MRVPILLMVATLSLLRAGGACAEIQPHPGSGDPHVQTVAYDPNQVIVLKVALGYQMSVDFGTEQRVRSVSVGNAGPWQVIPNHEGRFIFLKPLRQAAPTNMTVVTDACVFIFSIEVSPYTTLQDAYLVRLTYPNADAAGSQPPTQRPQAAPYRLTGDRSILPSEVYDDGRFTYILWPSGTEMPATYAVEASGEESLVNGTMREGAFVIDEVATRLIFRSGSKTASASRTLKPGRAVSGDDDDR